MSVQEIEAEILKLSTQDLAQLVDWLQQYHAQVWERQIEQDLETGRLDRLLDEVDREHKAGQSRPL